MTRLIGYRWYWVSDGDSTWPAFRDPYRAGGWSNQDGWEDREGTVVKWQLIPLPVWHPEHPHWIDVSERMPPADEWVLVVLGRPEGRGRYITISKCKAGGIWWMELIRPTHWMQFPALPPD